MGISWKNIKKYLENMVVTEDKDASESAAFLLSKMETNPLAVFQGSLMASKRMTDQELGCFIGGVLHGVSLTRLDIDRVIVVDGEDEKVH